MNRYAFYISILATAAIGLVLSILFFPSEREEALMYFYDRRFEDAQEKFSKLYREGDRSVAVTMPLVWIDLHYAKVEQAIGRLENFVRENPDIPEAREYLGKLYYDADRPYDYLLNLKDLYPFKPTKKNLKEQEHLYGQFGNLAGRTEAIKSLIHINQATEEEYLELAYYKFSKDPMAAAEVLDRLLFEFPLSSLSFETVHLIFAMYADAGEKNKASRLLGQYLNSVRLDVRSALRLANTLKDRDMYAEADRVFLSLPPEVQRLPGIMIAHAELMTAYGHPARAYEMLRENYDRGTLPKPLYKTLLSLALDHEDPERFDLLLASLPLEEMPEKTLFKIAKKALENKEAKRALAVSRQLSPEFLKEHLVLAIALGIAANPPSEEEEKRLHVLHEEKEFSDPEEAVLADLYEEKEYVGLARKILLKVESLEEVPSDSLYELANLYRELDMAEEGIALLEKIKERENAEKGRLLLIAAQGNVEEVLRYMEEHELDRGTLSDLFYAVTEVKQFPLALQIAEALNKKGAVPESDAILATALILNGKINEGTALFQKLKNQGKEISEPYIFALSTAVQKDTSLLDPLHEAVLSRLQKKGLPEKERRNLGFILLDNEFKAEAAEVFFGLSHEKPFESADVQTLLSAWGEKPEDKQLEWIRKRAKEAKEEEKGKWLSHLSYTGSPQTVIDLVSAEELRTDAIADAYIEAASSLKDKELVAQAVETVVAQEERLPRLKGLASITYGEGLPDIAERIYEKILAKDPGDPEALKILGIIAYGRGEVARAKYLLFFYLQTENPDYQGFLTYGDILNSEGCRRPAKTYWRCAKSLILRLEEQSAETQAALAQIYFRLDCLRAAFFTYKKTVRDNPALKTDFAHFLMDIGEPKQAGKLLFSRRPETEEERTNLLLAKARYFKLVNKVKKTVAILCSLVKTPEVFSALADAHYVSGHTLESLTAINCAIRRQPTNSFYRKAKEEILIDYDPYLFYEHEYRKTGEIQQENFTRFFLAERLRHNAIAEQKFEYDRMRLGAYIRESDGATVPFDGGRWRAEASLTRLFCKGRSLKGSLYAAERIFGFGIEGKRAWFRDLFRFLAQYHYPEWDFVETTIEYGTRDRLAIGWEKRIMPNLQGTCTAGVNNYNLYGFSSAAASWTVNALFTLNAPEYSCLMRLIGRDSSFSFNYNLDKEKFVHIREKLNFLGEPFAPLPATSRMVHSFYLFLSKRFTPFFSIEGYGGYNYDQVAKGKMSPIGGASLLFFKSRGLQAKLTYNHSTSTENQQNTVDSFIASLKYTY